MQSKVKVKVEVEVKPNEKNNRYKGNERKPSTHPKVVKFSYVS